MANINPGGRLCRRAAAAGCATLILIAFAACSSTNTEHSAFGAAVASTIKADPQVHELLVNSCFDCHSNRPPAAWNARLAPSYLFGRDKARQALNFSEWQEYPARRKQKELEAIAKVVADRSMPPGDYDFVHPGAGLSAEQRQVLQGWASSPALPAH